MQFQIFLPRTRSFSWKPVHTGHLHFQLSSSRVCVGVPISEVQPLLIGAPIPLSFFCLLYIISTKKKMYKIALHLIQAEIFKRWRKSNSPSPIPPIRNLPSGDELHSLSLSLPHWHVSILFCSLYLEAFTEALPVQYFCLHGAMQDVSFWQKGLWLHSLKY